MKATRLLKTMAVLTVCTALALSSCGRKQGRTRGGSNGGKSTSTSEKIADNINVLAATTNWDETQKLYKGAKVDIENLVRNEVTKADLNSLADKGYCHSMDTIMRLILTDRDNCENRHNEFKTIMAEREKFGQISSPLHSEVESLYNEHQRLVQWIQGIGKRQKVESFKDRYDNDYDTKVLNQAKKELEKDPPCPYIRRNLKTPPLKSRHKSFGDDLVKALEENSTNPFDANVVVGRLGFYKAKYGEDATYKGWMARLSAFEEKHKEN